MPDASRAVFLSYRRNVSWAMAHAVRGDLTQHGFDVFMDIQSLDNGEFERTILAQIEARRHFLVLLEPGTLDRIADEGDWVRREIAHALTHNRNVVPLVAPGVRMPVAGDLPADLTRLCSLNGLSVPHDYFSEAMQKLRDRFLRPSPGVRDAPLGPLARIDVTPSTVDLVWNPVEGAAGYDVQSAGSGAFTGARTFRATGSRHRIGGDSSPGGIWYRVRRRAHDGDPPGPWSEAVEAPRRQSVPTPRPTAEQLVPPVLVAESIPRGVELKWTAIPGAVAYELWHSPEPTFNYGRVINRSETASHRHEGERVVAGFYKVCAEFGPGVTGPFSAFVRAQPGPP